MATPCGGNLDEDYYKTSRARMLRNGWPLATPAHVPDNGERELVLPAGEYMHRYITIAIMRARRPAAALMRHQPYDAAGVGGIRARNSTFVDAQRFPFLPRRMREDRVLRMLVDAAVEYASRKMPFRSLRDIRHFPFLRPNSGVPI